MAKKSKKKTPSAPEAIKISGAKSSKAKKPVKDEKAEAAEQSKSAKDTSKSTAKTKTTSATKSVKSKSTSRVSKTTKTTKSTKSTKSAKSTTMKKSEPNFAKSITSHTRPTPEMRIDSTETIVSDRRRHHRHVIAGFFLLILLAAAAFLGYWYIKHGRLDFWRTNQQIQKEHFTSNPTKKTNKIAKISYSKTIGFVGDSITYGASKDKKAVPAPKLVAKKLGDGYKAINRGVNGSTTEDWLDDLLDPSLDEFKDEDVDIVMVMLGTNDVSNGIKVDGTIKNLRKICDKLIDNGAKIVIVSKIPYAGVRNDEKVRDINNQIDKLVSTDKVYIGDTESYQFFRSNQDQLPDHLHPDKKGYEKLADLWVKAFTRIVVEPTKTTRKLSTSQWRKGSKEDLTFTIDKPVEWFVTSMRDQSWAKVDDAVLNDENSTISGNNKHTVVKVEASYLEKQDEGKHRLEVKFLDGTKFSVGFRILKKK